MAISCKGQRGVNTCLRAIRGVRVNPIYIHVFLWRYHKKMKHLFRLVNPVYDMDTYIFKVNVFTKQAKYE